MRAEPAQSKRTWKCHRAILCKDLQEKYRAPTLGQPMTTVLRNRNAHGHLARTVLYENLQKKCRAPRPGQPFCASRACAVETHMDMPQEPFYARIYRKNTAPQRRDNRFAQSKCTWTSRKCCFMGEFRGKMPCPKTGTTVFRKPAQSKRTWTCHKSHIVPEFLQEKCHAPRSRRRLCASLHSRNAHGHVDKNNFCEIYRKKCQKPDGAPTDQAPALTPTAPVYRKNPSVWTRGLGENVFKELCGFTPWTPVLVCPATKNEGASC